MSSSSSRRGRARTSSNSTPDLLWVNRTPESETLSATRQERDELRTITSHARHWRAALRRQQRLYNAQNQASHAQSVVGWGRTGNLSETSSAETSAAPSPVPLTTTVSTTPDNPFPFLETPEDAWWSQTTFDNAVNEWLPSIFQNLQALDDGVSPESITDTITHIVQGCLANRMHMYCLLAASSGFFKFVLHLRLDRNDAPEYCMSKALQHLRHYLSGQIQPGPRADQMLVFDLLALSTFERYTTSFEGARTHLNMVANLVQMLGGIANLDAPIRALYRLWDLQSAGGSGDTPFIALDWDPGLLPREQMRDIILPSLARGGIVPSGVALVQYGFRFRPDIRTLVIDVVQWFQVVQYCHVTNFSQSPIERWSARRAYALAHRLLSLPSNDPESPGGANIYAEVSKRLSQVFLLVIADMESTRAARTASSGPTAAVSDPSRFSFTDVSRLRAHWGQDVEGTRQEDVQDEELRFWMACLGVQLAQREEDHQWFVGVARPMAQRLGIRTTDHLAQFMSRYVHRCTATGMPKIDGLEPLIE
ncbi:hypothetical protein PV08_00198 [Exophiala spinifera]|uniref:Transcription factor domain-containing protein n=1 Tax=Exophiala spinifera TaxID=91928 RepID=A0A0D2BM11_9EURO|nr:uncharacterized protein PV08_00198 [Exophiala spinifera]KIW19625.1 hypothetical protein PV08_00198 [Exophiala spinifera]